MNSENGWDKLRDLARELPYEEPNPERVEAVRNDILSRAQRLTVPPRAAGMRRRVVVASALAAAAVVALGVLSFLVFEKAPRETAEVAAVLRAEVRSLTASTFTRVGTQPDEIVRLKEGTITVQVDKLRPGERFRVMVGDATVEVRGTVFDVTAADDHLRSVRVHEGKVEVRPNDGAVAVLLPGQEWPTAAVPDQHAVEVATAAAISQPAEDGRPAVSAPARHERDAVAEKPTLHEAHRVTTAASTTSPGSPPQPDADARQNTLPRRVAETSFEDGWRALRTGDPRGAATAFDRVLADSPEDPLAEDAGFWKAVCFDRAGLDADAAAAFGWFLGRYPASPRAGEASAMLGWLLLDAGDLDAAEARFRSAAADKAAHVRQAAAKGLEAIASRRAGSPAGVR